MRYTSIICLLLTGCLTALAQTQTETPGSFHQDLCWAPDSSRLVFSAMRKGRADLYTIKADGTGLTRLTENLGNNLWASYSPNGHLIAFHSDRAGGQGDIWVMNANGSNPRRLTHDGGRNTYPSWSRDGKRIVFGSNRIGGMQLFVMNADGSNQVRITKPTADDAKYYNPVWSPRKNANRIVFYSDRDDHKDQIMVISADGSDERVLSGGIGHNIFPSWLPDGKRIIFSSERDGVARATYIVNADGTNVTRFEPSGASAPKLDSESETQNSKLLAGAFFVRWSPNGKQIAYIVGHYPTTEIYIMRKDGSNVIKLTK